METKLSDTEIVRISTILSSDAESASHAQREKIYGHLGLPPADLHDLKQRVLSDRSGAFGFFTQTLFKYHCMMGSLGTVEKIIECLRDLNLISVVEKIQAAGNTASESIWFNVEFPVESFTGREAEISELHELLTKNAGNVTVINQISTVYGLGGIGKSEIAKKYAQTYYFYYHGNVIWIESEKRESWRSSMQSLFQLYFGISEEISENKPDTELMGILYDRFSNKKCLLIFDNYEEFDVLKLLPKKSRRPTDLIPNVLITSRNSSWEYGIKVLQLDVLTAEEAVQLVEKQIKNNMTNDTVKLVTELQCFPLALQQAVAYIKAELSEETNPIEIYLQLFYEQDVSKLLNYTDEQSLSQNEKTTFSTWSVTLQTIKLREFGLLATRIINLVSCLEPDNIPGCILENMKSSSVEFLTDPTEAIVSRPEVNAAIALLKKYSMISGPPGVINVHRLVQRVVRLNVENNILSVLGEGIELLIKYPDTKNDDLVKSLLPHAESIWKRSLQYPDFIRKYGYFPINICEKLYFYGRYVEMLQLVRDSKPEMEVTLGEKHKWTIRIKYWEVVALFRLGEYSQSLELSQTIYSISNVELGSEHETTLSISNLVAMNLAMQGKYSEPLEMFDRILAIVENKFGPEHQRVLTGFHNKAVALLHLGRVDESLKLKQNVYEVEKRVLGEEHADTLTSRDLIADILFKKGMFEEALSISEMVYETRKRVVGEDHPHTLYSLNLLQRIKTKAKSPSFISTRENSVLDDAPTSSSSVSTLRSKFERLSSKN